MPERGDLALALVARKPHQPCGVAQIFRRRQIVVEADLIRQVADLALDRERLAHGVVASTRAWPSEMSVSPSSIRMVVVLPAPFGPSRPKISPAPPRTKCR